MLNFLFYLFITIDIVISGSIKFAIPSNKGDNEIKKEESLFNTIQGKHISLTLTDNQSSLNDPFMGNSNRIKPKTKNRDISNNNENTLVTNDNHNKSSTTGESEILESSIPERMKNDPFLMEIFKGVPKDMPIVLIDIIGDYSKYHDNTIDEFYDRIKRELSKFSGKVILDLYDPNLIS